MVKSALSASLLHASLPNALANASLMSPVRMNSPSPSMASRIQPNAESTRPVTNTSSVVMSGLTYAKRSLSPPTTLASRLPTAPSMVLVLVAACLATSVMPRSSSAWLNSSAVIWPSAIASLKFPV